MLRGALSRKCQCLTFTTENGVSGRVSGYFGPKYRGLENLRLCLARSRRLISSVENFCADMPPDMPPGRQRGGSGLRVTLAYALGGFRWGGADMAICCAIPDCPNQGTAQFRPCPRCEPPSISATGTNPPLLVGWWCPNCKAYHAPHISTCPSVAPTDADRALARFAGYPY